MLIHIVWTENVCMLAIIQKIITCIKKNTIYLSKQFRNNTLLVIMFICNTHTLNQRQQKLLLLNLIVEADRSGLNKCLIGFKK